MPPSPPPPPQQQQQPTDTDTDLTDPFDALLSLEDTYYTEGHALGTRDGARAGLIEGRVFGLEKGFEKFIALGQQHGRAAIWAARMPGTAFSNASPGPSPSPTTTSTSEAENGPATTEGPEKAQGEKAAKVDEGVKVEAKLPQLQKPNPRLARHITTLHALSEPLSLPTQNTEDGVSDVEDRARRAAAKMRLIENLVREGSFDTPNTSTTSITNSSAGDASASALETEITSTAEPARPKKQAPKRASGRAPMKVSGGRAAAAAAGPKGGEKNMEDFGA